MSNESFSYLVSGEWSDVTNSFDLLDAVVTLRMFDEANIRVGQFVPQFYAGYVTDPTQLTTLNYSVSALTFGQGRGAGIEAFRSFGDFEVSAFYNNGFDTAGEESVTTTMPSVLLRLTIWMLLCLSTVVGLMILSRKV